MKQMNSAAGIVVAAGRGTRMAADGKKQYMSLAGRPLLSYAVSAFAKCEAVSEVFLVIARQDEGLCRTSVLKPLGLEKRVHLVLGGKTRQESVYNGIRAAEGLCDIVAIHDGARPLVRPEDIRQTIEAADTFGACIMALPAVDTVKTVDQNHRIVETLKRNTVWLAQTPQAFRYELIRQAHESARQACYAGTDDAELVERQGHPVTVLAGSRENIKITTPRDLALAQVLVAERGASS